MQKSTILLLSLLLSLLLGAPLSGQDPLDLPSPRSQSGSVRTSKVRSAPARTLGRTQDGVKASSRPAQDRVRHGGKSVLPPSPGALGAPMGGPLAEDRGPTTSRLMSEDIRERLRTDAQEKPSESGPGLRSGRGPMQEDQDRSGSAGDLLDRVLDRLGGRKAWLALGAIAVQRNLKANDVKGKLLFAHRFWHWARLSGTVPADEIQWSDSFRYGRRGGRVWARSSDVDRPDLEESIRGEVQTWGFLLRFPFNLRNRDRYRVLPEEKVMLLGQSFLRLRVLDRAGESTESGGDPLSSKKIRNAVDLYLDPEELLPLFVEFRRDGRTRRIHLDQYKPIVEGGPLVAHRRTVLGEDGETPSLEITWEISKKRKWR